MKKAVIIITGGPGSGKSSLVDHLGREGYRVGTEAAREIMDEQLSKGGDTLPWKNILKFRQEVFERRLEFLNSVPDGELAFSDRGIPDQLAFARYQESKDLAWLVEKAKSYRYFPHVFITSPWKEIFRQDQVRTETFEEACRIHQFIFQTYQELGYTLIELPKTAIKSRIQFIKNHITELNYEFIKKKVF